MKKLGGLLALCIVLYGSSYLFANAYALPSGSSDANNGLSAVSLPQLPPDTFNVNWNSFLNNLPLQNFIRSLESIGSSSVSQELQNPQPINGVTPQSIFEQIDNWTQPNLGFRFSDLFSFILQLISWILAIAKAIVDWLLTLIHS